MTTKKKQQYRIRNWPDYNKALVRRGSLTLWFDSRSIETWRNTDQPAHRGRARLDADLAILCSLLLREVYHLPLRATAGLVCSLLSLLEVDLPVPHYSTLSRRARALDLHLSARARTGPLHLIIESTGLKLDGEGEGRTRGKGWTKRRTWRKLHISMDAESQQLTSSLITQKEVVDPRVLPRLLTAVAEPIERVTADGAYDSRECYRAIDQRGARAVMPPRKGSVLWKDD